mgnify:CR=1 FL=1
MREHMPVRAIAVGCGRMGTLGIRLMYNKGIQIVGAVDSNPAIVGKDVGEHAQLGLDLGVKISDDLEQVLTDCAPDIAVCALFSFVEKNESVFNTIIRHGVNVLTTCDEMHFAWNTSSAACNRIHRLAKEYGVTVTASGLQEVFWMNLPCLMASGMNDLKRIAGVTTFNTDEYGPSLADAYNIGLTVEEFQQKFRQKETTEEEHPDGFLMRATNDAIISRLGLRVKDYKVEYLPYTADRDVFSIARNRIIPAGDVIGTEERVITTTIEGIEVVSSDIGYVFYQGEGDICKWNLYGTPDVEVNVPNLNSYIFTMGDLVNRIPDVINAEPGYVTNSTLPVGRYYSSPMNHFID